MIKVRMTCTEIRSTTVGRRVKMIVKIQTDFNECENPTQRYHDGTMKFNVDKSAFEYDKFEVGKTYDVEFNPVD